MSHTDRQPSVVAAVPTYNMGEETLDLLSQLCEQELNGIFVLDDHSTDDTADKIEDAFGDSVNLIRGESNLGQTGNRNRIIPVLGKYGFGAETIIMFIDADMKIESDKPIATTVRSLFQKHPEAGMIGGQVLTADGTWTAWNYGPLPLLKWLSTSRTLLKYENLRKIDPAQAESYWKEHQDKLTDWPNPYGKPGVKEVGWLIENFNFIKAKTYSEVGGYNPALRYCEALDIGRKLEKRGEKRVFDPELTARHLQIDNRGGKRVFDAATAILWLATHRA